MDNYCKTECKANPNSKVCAKCIHNLTTDERTALDAFRQECKQSTALDLMHKSELLYNADDSITGARNPVFGVSYHNQWIKLAMRDFALGKMYQSARACQLAIENS